MRENVIGFFVCFFFFFLSQIDISTFLEILSKLFQTKICIICIVSSNVASLAIPIPYSTYAYYIFILPSCYLSPSFGSIHDVENTLRGAASFFAGRVA